MTGKRAESIASPEKYPNLFDQYEESLTAEAFYKSTAVPQLASDYGEIEAITERDLIDESIGFEADDNAEAKIVEAEEVAQEESEDEVAVEESEEDEPEVQGWGQKGLLGSSDLSAIYIIYNIKSLSPFLCNI